MKTFVFIIEDLTKSSFGMISDTENYKNLKTFFNDEYHSLKAYAQSRIKDAADRDAEDIVQDVALSIFSRAEGSLPINNIAGFVYSSIKNKIIDLMRTKREETRFESEMELRLNEFVELFYSPSDNSYSDDMMIELKKAIGSLHPRYREIILAIDFEGMSYKVISRNTGIPEGTLMSRRHRALSLLFKHLENKKDNN